MNKIQECEDIYYDQGNFSVLRTNNLIVCNELVSASPLGGVTINTQQGSVTGSTFDLIGLSGNFTSEGSIKIDDLRNFSAFVVGPNTEDDAHYGSSEYSTIASAIAAANALTNTAANPAVIFIKPGTYDESITCQDFVYLCGISKESGLSSTYNSTVTITTVNVGSSITTLLDNLKITTLAINNNPTIYIQNCNIASITDSVTTNPTINLDRCVVNSLVCDDFSGALTVNAKDLLITERFDVSGAAPIVNLFDVKYFNLTPSTSRAMTFTGTVNVNTLRMECSRNAITVFGGTINILNPLIDCTNDDGFVLDLQAGITTIQGGRIRGLQNDEQFISVTNDSTEAYFNNVVLEGYAVSIAEPAINITNTTIVEFNGCSITQLDNATLFSSWMVNSLASNVIINNCSFTSTMSTGSHVFATVNGSNGLKVKNSVFDLHGSRFMVVNTTSNAIIENCTIDTSDDIVASAVAGIFITTVATVNMKNTTINCSNWLVGIITIQNGSILNMYNCYLYNIDLSSSTAINVSDTSIKPFLGIYNSIIETNSSQAIIGVITTASTTNSANPFVVLSQSTFINTTNTTDSILIINDDSSTIQNVFQVTNNYLERNGSPAFTKYFLTTDITNKTMRARGNTLRVYTRVIHGVDVATFDNLSEQ